MVALAMHDPFQRADTRVRMNSMVLRFKLGSKQTLMVSDTVFTWCTEVERVQKDVLMELVELFLLTDHLIVLFLRFVSD